MNTSSQHSPKDSSRAWAIRAAFPLIVTLLVLFSSSALAQLALDKIHGYPIVGTASYTTNAGGHTGSASDWAMDLGNGGGTLLTVTDPALLAAINTTTAADKLSVSLWVKLNEVSATSAFWFYSPTSGGNQRGFQAHIPWSDGTIYFDTAGCCDGGTQRINQNVNNTTFPAYTDATWWNSWHHFVFVKDGSTKTVWIDGTVFLQGQNTGTLPTDINLLTVGSGIVAPAGTPSLHGQVDDFAVFGSGLTTNDVQLLFSGTKPDALTAANPLAYWDFNAPQKPLFSAIQAGPGDASVSPDISAYYVIANGSTTVQINTIKLSLNGSNVTSSATIVPTPLPSPVPSGTGATVYYASPTVFPAGSTQTMTLEFSDNATPPNVFSNTWPVVIQIYNGYVTDAKNGLLGFLEGSSAFTPDRGGHTGLAGDRAIDLNGVGSGGDVHVGTANILNQGAANNTLSVSLWMKMYRISDGGTIFARSPSSSGGQRGFAALAWSDEKIYFDTAGCCDTFLQRVSAAMSTHPGYTNSAFWNSWHNYAFVYNGTPGSGGLKEIWVDGIKLVSDFTDFSSMPLPTDFRDLFMGYDPADNAYQQAVIDDVAVYATALSATSISALTNGTLPTALAGETVLAYWDFNTLSPGPPFISLTSTPGPGSTNALPNVGANIVILNRSTQVDTNTLRVELNGTNVTGLCSFIPSDAGVTVNFLSPTLLPQLSTNRLTVVFSDNGTPAFVSSNSWTFKVIPYGFYSRDAVHGYLGLFQGNSIFSSADNGHAGRALDVTMAGSTGVRVVDPPFLTGVNAGAAKDTLSISYWAKLTAVGNSAFWLTSPSAGSGSGFRGFQAHCPWNDTARTIYFDSAGCCNAPQRISTASANIPGYPGDSFWTNWHHFVFLKNGGDKQAYVDGQLFLTGTGAAALAPDMTALTIASGNGANPLRGFVDDFAVFAGALSPASITALASGTSPLTLGDTNLVAFWNFDDVGPAFIASRTPAPNTTGVAATGPASHIIVTLMDGSTTVVSNSIRLALNGSDVTGQLAVSSPAPGVMRLEYAPPLLPSNSTNLVTLVFSDSGTPPNLVSNTWSYVTQPYTGVTRDILHGYQGLLSYSAQYTADRGGHSGQPGDYAMDLTAASRGEVYIDDASFLRVAATNNTMTFAFWCKLYNNANNSAFWVNSPSSSGTQRGFQAHLPYGNVIYFDTAGCCDGTLYRINANLNTFSNYVAYGNTVGWWTNWHHFAFVYNLGVKTVWIDGSFFFQGTSAAPLPVDFTDMFIGRDPPDGLNLKGQLDDFATFASPVSADNIVLLSQGTLPTALTGEALLAYWNFNDAPARPTISIGVAAGKVSITYTGTLQACDTVNGNYTNVVGAPNPYVVDTSKAPRLFYRSAP